MQAQPGWAILKPEEKKKDGDLFLPDSAKSDLQRGTIVDICHDEYVNSGVVVSVPSSLDTGARVVYKRYHDQDLDLDGEKYKIVPINQIAVIL